MVGTSNKLILWYNFNIEVETVTNISLEAKRIAKRKKRINKKRIFLVTLFFLVLASLLTVYVTYNLFNDFYKVQFAFLDIDKFYLEKDYINYIIFIGLFLVIVILSILLDKLIYHFQNKKFKEIYKNAIFKECKFDELYFLEKKKQYDIDHYENQIKYNNLKGFKRLFAFSDTDADISLELAQISYLKNKKKRNALLVSSSLTVVFEHFIQIRNYSSLDEKKYLNEEIERFGDCNRSYLKMFDSYSTFGSSTYNFIKSELATVLTDFIAFTHCGISLSIYSNQLNIVLDGLNLKLYKPLNEKFKPIDFDHQVEAVISLHNYLFKITKIVEKINL